MSSGEKTDHKDTGALRSMDKNPKIQIQQENKQKHMQIRKPLSLLVAIVSLLFVVALHFIWSMIDMSIFWTELAVGLVLLAFGVLYWGFKPDIGRYTGEVTILSENTPEDLKKSAKISGLITGLTVLYSLRTNNLDTLINSVQLKYVVFRNRVFVMPNWLNPFVKEGKISYQVYDGEMALRKYINKEYGTEAMMNHEPRIDELGFKAKDGYIVWVGDEIDEMITKLKETKDFDFEDFRIVFLQRIDFRVILHKRIHARRLLLLKESTKESFVEGQDFALDLIAKRIISDTQDLGMLPWESCKSWSKHQGYVFHPYRYRWSEITKTQLTP